MVSAEPRESTGRILVKTALLGGFTGGIVALLTPLVFPGEERLPTGVLAGLAAATVAAIQGAPRRSRQRAAAPAG